MADSYTQSMKQHPLQLHADDLIKLILLPGILLALIFPMGCGTVDVLNLKPGAKSIFAGIFDKPTPSEAVELAVNEYDPDKRYRGLRQLNQAPFTGEEVYLELFRDSADDPDARVRSAAMAALANHGNPEDVPYLITGLTDKQEVVRLEAARGLQRIHAESAIDPLVRSIREKNEESNAVRAEAANALGQYPEPRVLEALITLLLDRSLAVNWASLEALETLTSRNFGLDPAQWSQWINQQADPFVDRQAYYYPVFNRPKNWYEHVIPFFDGPPNEMAAQPVGIIE